MTKKKDDYIIRKNFKFAENTSIILRNSSSLLNMNETQFVEFLIHSWNDKFNANEQLKKLGEKEAKVQEMTKDIMEERKEIVEKIGELERIKKEKQKNLDLIIGNIARIIKEGRITDAEEIAKIQGVIMGIEPIELMIRASKLRDL